MAGTKQKPDATEVRWQNQVIKTANGRLLVRDVDVPESAWEKLASGQSFKASTSFTPRALGNSAPVTNSVMRSPWQREPGL